MPTITSVLARFTNQQMVYWQKIGSDPFGKPVYALPVQIAVRWEDKQQEVILPDGRKVWSKGYVILAQTIAPGSLIFLGQLTDWQAMPTYPAIPTVNQGGREVLLVKTTPDIKAISYIYEVYI